MTGTEHSTTSGSNEEVGKAQSPRDYAWVTEQFEKYLKRW